MFPGFISLYRNLQKNEDKKVSLYFYPGLTDEGKPIYMALDLTALNYDYTFTKLDDNAVVYTFNDTNINKVTAKLVDRKSGDTEYQTIMLA